MQSKTTNLDLLQLEAALFDMIAIYWLNESSLNGNDDAKKLLATLN